MDQTRVLPTGRRSFRSIIPEITQAAGLLDRAADAHVAGDHEEARALILESNFPALRAWLESIWGKGSPHIHARTVDNSPPLLSRGERVVERMPSAAVKRDLVLRDGHHCRLCGLPVIRSEVRQHLCQAYPDALPWGRTNVEQHPAFQVFWLQYDHIVPHARGGTNDLSNLLIACAACNFGRMNFTLAEVGFASLDTIPLTLSAWDGLERVLPVSRRLVTSNTLLHR